MEHISKTTKKALKTATQLEAHGSTNKEISLSAELIELIFRTFARRFMHRWAIAHEDKQARQLWWRDLAEEGITDLQVVTGLNDCIGLKWPPSVGEFISYCRRKDKPTYYIALPKPKTNEKVARIEIIKMKRCLK